MNIKKLKKNNNENKKTKKNNDTLQTNIFKKITFFQQL
jgi:hypothetical protein